MDEPYFQNIYRTRINNCFNYDDTIYIYCQYWYYLQMDLPEAWLSTTYVSIDLSVEFSIETY